MIEVNWEVIRKFVVDRALKFQYIDLVNRYFLLAIDGPLILSCSLPKSRNGSSEQTDFETNFKPSSNPKLRPLDQSGRPILRAAAAPEGWHFQVNSMEISTATLNGYYNKKLENDYITETDLGFVTHSLYDSNNQLIDSQLNELSAVKTQIDFMPNHDLELIGAMLFQSSVPASDCRFWVIGLPGITNTSFGQGGINLKNVGLGESINVDGRAAKYLPYNFPFPGTNKIRIIIKHPAGFKHTIQIVWELFKQ